MASHRFQSKIQAPFHDRQARGGPDFCCLLQFCFIPFSPQSLSPATLTLLLCLTHSRLVPLPPSFTKLTVFSVVKILSEFLPGLDQSQLEFHLLETPSFTVFSPPQFLPVAFCHYLNSCVCYVFIFCLSTPKCWFHES